MKLIKLCAPAWMDKEYPKKAKERKLQKFYNFLKSKNIVIEFYHGTSDISWELINEDGMMSPPTWRSRGQYEGRTKGLDKLFFTKHIPTAIRYARREVKSWDNDDRFQRYKEEKGIDLDRKAEPIIIKKNVPLHYLDEIKGVIYGTHIYNETSSSNNIRNIILSEYSDEEKLSKIRSLIEDSGEDYSEFTIKGAVPISREEGFQHIEKMNSKDFWIKYLERHPGSYKFVPEELENDPDILQARKNGWIKKIENDPSNYKNIPEELKNDLDILQATKNGWIYNPYMYENAPEELKLKFSDTIREVADTVSESIKENGHPPDFAYDWAKQKLEEGTESYVTDIWIPRINKYIEKNGSPPDFAYDWAIKKLNEKNPESYVTDIWIPRINKYIEKNGIPPDFAYGWARNKLEEGTESYVIKIWIPSINKFIEKNGSPPGWAEGWAKKNTEKCIEGINKYIEKYGKAPDFASGWARNKLEEGTESYVTDIWIPRINKYIEKNGSPPDFAYDWAKKKLNEGTESYVTDIWIPRINKFIEKNGSPPLWARLSMRVWVKKNPEKCIEGINKYIEKNNKFPISFNFFKDEYYRIINQRNIQEPTREQAQESEQILQQMETTEDTEEQTTETTETKANNWYCLYKLTKKKEKFNLSKFAQGLIASRA